MSYRQITAFYAVRIKDQVAYIHYSPLTLLYFVSAKQVLKQRKRAMKKLQDKLKGEWKEVQVIESESFWIDFSRDFPGQTTKKPARLIDRFMQFYLAMTNLYNLLGFRVRTWMNLWKRNLSMYQLRISKEEFLMKKWE